MSNREQKRVERRKRKERASAKAEVEADIRAAARSANGGSDAPVSPADRAARVESGEITRSEAKNIAARAELEPLGPGERPTVVTIGAVVSALIAISIVAAYIAGIEVDGERPPFLSAFAPALLMGVMAWGLWRARYWAVLGLQSLLVILMVATSLGLVQAEEATQWIGNTVILAGSGALFYFMIKAWARIQMPERPPL